MIKFYFNDKVIWFIDWLPPKIDNELIKRDAFWLISQQLPGTFEFQLELSLIVDVWCVFTKKILIWIRATVVYSFAVRIAIEKVAVMQACT